MRRCATLVLVAMTLAAAPAQGAFPDGPPSDPLFDRSPFPNAVSEQWNLSAPAGGFDRGISVERAWPLSLGAGVTIADVDVGVEHDHPDLAGRWALNAGETGEDASGRPRASNGVDDDRNGYVDDWRGWDFYARDGDATSDTRNAHGTNVAGVLGAATDNGLGIAGIAPQARIMPIRTADDILHQGGRLAEGIVYAVDNGARAISMSLGADSFSRSLRAATRYAHRRGAVIAVAAGNEFHFHHHQPQAHDEVLAVGGVNPDSSNLSARDQSLAQLATRFDVKASYSDYGPHLDVVAPTHVPTTDWGGGFRMTWDGTSAATPHVAATAALVLARGRALGLGLSAAEAIQILRMSADDLADPGQGYAPGWDRLSGWGRVNAAAAVERAAAGRVPPVADIRSPEWYAPVRSARLAVRGIARGRSAVSWRLELGAGEQPGEWRELASGGATPAGGAALARVNAAGLAPGPHTLRLRATDAAGNLGEDRALFNVMRDGSLRRGFPRRLATSGEASPALADLDRDGALDIVVATSDGSVQALSGRTGRSLRGWPRRMKAVGGAAAAARRIGTLRAGFLSTPAVGDVAGGRSLEVLVGGLDGRLYAWDARGRALRGFPFRIGLRRPAESGRLDAAIYASPALADLDRNGKLDVVFGAADQRVYALRGNGRLLPGWPVLARDGADGDVAKILSSPAVGDLNGDGSPDVVEGTAEAYGSTPSMSGRVHAWDARGRPLPGWPVAPTGLAVDSIPLAGQGVPDSPVLADVDGDGRDEVAAAAFTGQPELYRGDGTRMGGEDGHFAVSGRGARSPSAAPSALALGANAAFGRTAPDGPLHFFGGLVDSRLAAAQSSPATRVEFDHLLGGWDAGSGAWLDAWPRPMEGWLIVAGPAVADVDGDSRAETIAGSSGNVLHAFREDGSEPPGWPKDVGGWLLAAPAVGDVDGDGRLEVVAVTRDGWLWAWDTPAPARSGALQWPAVRHHVRNTGRYG
jgi:subtilisin family serine protease